MERKFIFSTEEFYHLYNRGNSKRDIFLNEFDKKRFVKLLFVCNSTKPVVFKTIQGLPLEEIDKGETLVDIGAYCLMPNHFHLLIKEKMENGISVFMEKLATAYSMYFNKKNERVGKLFEGVFRATHANTDKYLKYLFSYIHLNPIKLIYPNWKEKGIIDVQKSKQFLEKYEFSSYREYVGLDRKEKLILNKDVFPKYFEDFKEFEFFMNEFFQGESLEDLAI